MITVPYHQKYHLSNNRTIPRIYSPHTKISRIFTLQILMKRDELLNLLDLHGEQLFFSLSDVEQYDLSIDILQNITKFPSDKELLEKLIQCLLNQPFDVQPCFIDSNLYDYLEISSKELCLPHLKNLIESDSYDQSYTGLTLAGSHICLEIASSIIKFLNRDDTDSSGIESALGLLKEIDEAYDSNFYQASKNKLTQNQLNTLSHQESLDRKLELLGTLSLADEAYTSRDFKKFVKILSPIIDELPSNYVTKYKISIKRSKMK